MELPSLPPPYVEYFISGLPECLENLQIDLTGTCYDTWVQTIGESQILKFGAQSSRIETFAFTTAPVEDSSGTSRQLEEQTPEARITHFYRFFNSVIGNRDLARCGAAISKGIIRGTSITVGEQLSFQ